MALNSINTNIAAYYAQQNIGRASTNASLSIARLSSGNRIVRAADDVAALSAGTSLRTAVTTLRAALTNTSQGSSLLQVADGALAQITDILQRQKAIATQAGSGSLSDIERGFLNQEFQNLALEIDRLASTTKFNQVNLLNGSLSKATALTTNVNNGTSTSGTSAAAIITVTAVASNNDEITVNGVSLKFTTSAPGTAAAVGKIAAGTTVTNQAENIVAFLNSSTDPRLANLTFSNAAGAISARWAGGLLTAAQTVTVVEVTDGANSFTTANGSIAVTNPTDGLGVDRTRAIGTVTGSILVSSGITAATAGTAINLNLVEDNADFIGGLGEGRIGNITGTISATDTAVFSLVVGDVTYVTAASDLTNATPVTLTFTGFDQFGAAKGGSFTLAVAGAAVATFDSQSELDPYTAQINEALAGVRFVQNRDIMNFQEGDVVSVGGVQVANFDGASANFRSDNLANVKIESVSITAPSAGTTDARFEVVIDGETYVSSSGIGNLIATNTVIGMQNVNDASKTFSLVLGATAIAGVAGVALDLSTQENADAVAAALETALSLDDAGAKLSFQIGSSSDDVLGVQINSVDTASLYNGVALNVLTQVGADAASAALDDALNGVTSVRADVGALQSRFNFATATIEVSIQNQDAARGVLLDTDIASEATSYATSQVQLQAGIAVLAQANLLPQNLLKLLG